MKEIFIKKELFNRTEIRKVLSVVLIITVLSMAGCGGQNNGNKNNKTASSSSDLTTSDSKTEDVNTEDEDSTDTSDISSESSDETDDDYVSSNFDEDESDYDSQNKDDVTSSADSENSEIDRLKGTLSFESSKKSNKPRDDADENLFTGDAAGLSRKLSGHYESEASALKTKIKNSKNTKDVYKITGTKYYVSPGGNDDNDGKSPETAIRTVDGLGNLDFEKGDAVLFERNSVFRLVQPLSTMAGVIYGSYGKGEKPHIYASPMNFAKVEWKPSNRKNIWKTNYVYDNACSIVFNNGKEIGYLKTSVRNLKKNTEFYQNEQESVIYMYCDKGNPSKIYESIEICPKMDIVNIPAYTSGVTVDNLCLKYSGTFAVDAVYNNNNITVSNCEIGFIGGTNNGSVRYGNAIQAWTNSSNFKVLGNYIYQSFDTAVTWQGQDTDGGKNIKYQNNEFSGNLLEYNNGDFEFWHNNAVIDNFVIKDNICRFTSLGWGTRADDAGYRGIEGFIYAKTHNMVHKNKITIKNNIIDCPGRQIINWNVLPENISKHYDISGTKIFINESYRTTGEALRGFKNKEDDGEMVFANSPEGYKTAVARFDKTAKVKCVEK